MADASNRLLQLRAVQFHYKNAEIPGERPVQYGLIAEEVAAVFPELVVLDEEGQPETVAYHMLPVLLLNELQKEHERNRAQSDELDSQERRLAELKQLREKLTAVEEWVANLRRSAKDGQLTMQ